MSDAKDPDPAAPVNWQDQAIAGHEPLDLGSLRVEPGERLVVGPHGSTRLSEDELRCLLALCRGPGEAVDRATLEQEIYAGEPPAPDAVEDCVGRLTRSLAEDPAGEGIIQPAGESAWVLAVAPEPTMPGAREGRPDIPRPVDWRIGAAVMSVVGLVILAIVVALLSG